MTRGYAMRFDSGAVLVTIREYKTKVGYGKSKSFTLYDTTLEEVENIIKKAIEK